MFPWLLLGVEGTLNVQQYKRKKKKNLENNENNKFESVFYCDVFSVFYTKEELLPSMKSKEMTNASLENTTN